MLTKRVMLAIGLGALTMIVGSALARQRFETEQQTARVELTQLAETVGADLHHVLREAMLANDHAGVRARVNATVQNFPEIVLVRIVGLNGKVYADSGRELQGASIAQDLPGCVECHQADPVPRLTSLNFLPDRLRSATPITNETTCTSCHNTPAAPALGVVLVDVSLASRQAQAANQLGLWLTGSLGAGLLVAALVSGYPKLIWRRPSLTWRWPAFHWGGMSFAVGVAVIVLSAGLVAARVEEHDAFCVACHTEPETTYYQRSLAAPADLASAHTSANVRCIQCHSVAGVAGRVETLALGAKNLAVFLTNAFHAPASAETPLHNDHCVKCHVEVTQTLSAQNHFHYFTAQWEDPTACVTCHPSHLTGLPADARFTDRAVMQAACDRCHASAVSVSP